MDTVFFWLGIIILLLVVRVIVAFFPCDKKFITNICVVGAFLFILIFIALFQYISKYNEINIVIFFTGFLFLTNFASDLIEWTLAKSNHYPPEDGSATASGFAVAKYTGMIERIIIYILMISNQPTLAGFIITAKALGNFKELSEKDCAQRYILGTLLSVSIALITGILIAKVLKWSDTSNFQLIWQLKLIN